MQIDGAVGHGAHPAVVETFGERVHGNNSVAMNGRGVFIDELVVFNAHFHGSVDGLDGTVHQNLVSLHEVAFEACEHVVAERQMFEPDG